MCHPCYWLFFLGWTETLEWSSPFLGFFIFLFFFLFLVLVGLEFFGVLFVCLCFCWLFLFVCLFCCFFGFFFKLHTSLVYQESIIVYSLRILVEFLPCEKNNDIFEKKRYCEVNGFQVFQFCSKHWVSIPSISLPIRINPWAQPLTQKVTLKAMFSCLHETCGDFSYRQTHAEK